MSVLVRRMLNTAPVLNAAPIWRAPVSGPVCWASRRTSLETPIGTVARGRHSRIVRSEDTNAVAPADWGTPQRTGVRPSGLGYAAADWGMPQRTGDRVPGLR